MAQFLLRFWVLAAHWRGNQLTGAVTSPCPITNIRNEMMKLLAE